MKKPLGRKNALARLEELCARSEQCSYDLCQKLYKWGVEQPYDDIIDSLIDGKYLDDERFAAAFVRDKYRFDRWGRRKIARALMAKRIPSAVISEALENIDAREYAMNCYNLLDARRRQLSDALSDYEKRARLLRFAAGRGYEPSLIMRLLDNPEIWD